MLMPTLEPKWLRYEDEDEDDDDDYNEDDDGGGGDDDDGHDVDDDDDDADDDDDDGGDGGDDDSDDDDDDTVDAFSTYGIGLGLIQGSLDDDDRRGDFPRSSQGFWRHLCNFHWNS